MTCPALASRDARVRAADAMPCLGGGGGGALRVGDPRTMPWVARAAAGPWAAELAHACGSAEVRQLYDGADVEIADLRCRTPTGARAWEVHSTGYHLVFPRAGVFARSSDEDFLDDRAPWQTAVGDPSRVLFVNPGETIRLGHPAPGGHASTIVTVSPELAAAIAASFRGMALPPRRAAVVEEFPVASAGVSPAALLRLHRLRRACAGARARGGAVPTDTLRGAEDESQVLVREVLRGAGCARAAIRRGEGPARGQDALRRHRALAEAAQVRIAAAPGAAHRQEQLAAALGVSPFHLAHVFRERTGLSVHQYLLRVRMSSAVARLSDGEVSLSKLALDLGFSSHSHFTSGFTRYFGATPTAVRCEFAGRSPLRLETPVGPPLPDRPSA